MHQVRMRKPKDQEFDFAKRIHISHVKSVVCSFQSHRNQGGPRDIRRKRGGRTQHGRPLSLNAHSGFAKNTRCRPIGRQDFLIPRAGNQLLRSRQVLFPFEPVSVGLASEGDGTTGSGEIQTRDRLVGVVCSRGLGPVGIRMCTADSGRGATPMRAHLDRCRLLLTWGSSTPKPSTVSKAN